MRISECHSVTKIISDNANFVIPGSRDSLGQCQFCHIGWQRFPRTMPILSHRVTEVPSVNANFVDYKQVIDIVFLSEDSSWSQAWRTSRGRHQHSQPNRSSFSKAARQSFVKTQSTHRYQWTQRWSEQNLQTSVRAWCLQGRASILLQRLNQTWRRPEEGGAVRKEQVFQVMLATLWPGSVRSALFILFFNQSD